MDKKVELLAPAGSYEALVAAVQNGADAIYMGGAEFSARAYAANFDREKIKEAIEYAHIRGVKIYFAVNTLVKDSEIDKLLEYINFLYYADVDAVIVQDLGALKLIKELYPDFDIHCSTQMTLHNSYGVNLLKNLGAKRVVLARELSLGEIVDIKNTTEVELEVFVHGALCVSYSGQCLMSSFIGGRSGNRGTCAQPCRKKYEIVSLNKEEETSNPFYYLSMRDLNTLENIHELIDSGVSSFKIEGRMKKPQYVAAVVGAYRGAMDTYLQSGKKFKDMEIEKQVAQMFNRKFTKGYIFNEKRKQVINIEKPNNSGVYIGQVHSVNRNKSLFSIYLEDDISHGDGIEVWGADNGGIVNKIYKDGRLTHEAQKGEFVEIEIRGTIRTGDEVYKTLDHQLIKHLEKTYEKDIENKKVTINGHVKIEIGKPMELILWDDESNRIKVKSTVLVERAEKVALTDEKVIKNMSKINNTPFMFEHIEIDLGPDSSVPLSAINELRREGIYQLIELRKNRNKRKQSKLKGLDKKDSSFNLRNNRRDMRLTVKVDCIEQLKVVLSYGVDRIYFSDVNNLALAVELCEKSNTSIFLKTPNIVKDKELQIFQVAIENNRVDGVLVGDLGMLVYVQENFKGLNIITDASFNLLNSFSIKQAESLEIFGLTLSQEMDFKSILNLGVSSNTEIECIVYGRTPVMNTEYCPLIHLDICDKKCGTCQQSNYNYKWAIRDEKDYSFPISRDVLGRTIIYNSNPIFMGDKVSSFKKTIVNGLRLDMTDESPEEITKILQIYKGIIEEDINQLGFKYTRGHFFKDLD